MSDTHVNRTDAALLRYTEIGDVLRKSAAEVHQCVDYALEKVSETGCFAYVDGSSGLGKTQLAFSLEKFVLYIPFAGENYAL